MAASIPTGPMEAPAPTSLPFGRETCNPLSGDRSMRWLLKRNCSLTPGQLLGVFGMLLVLALGIAGGFWMAGATLVLPFASAEVLALALALLIYARHAADREDICLGRRALTVVHVHGNRVEQVEFQPEWVLVEPEHGDRSLIELSGQGRRIVVGRFIRPEYRRQLADELRWALRRWHPAVAPVSP